MPNNRTPFFYDLWDQESLGPPLALPPLYRDDNRPNYGSHGDSRAYSNNVMHEIGQEYTRNRPSATNRRHNYDDDRSQSSNTTSTSSASSDSANRPHERNRPSIEDRRYDYDDDRSQSSVTLCASSPSYDSFQDGTTLCATSVSASSCSSSSSSSSSASSPSASSHGDEIPIIFNRGSIYQQDQLRKQAQYRRERHSSTLAGGSGGADYINDDWSFNGRSDDDHRTPSRNNASMLDFPHERHDRTPSTDEWDYVTARRVEHESHHRPQLGQSDRYSTTTNARRVGEYHGYLGREVGDRYFGAFRGTTMEHHHDSRQQEMSYHRDHQRRQTEIPTNSYHYPPR